MMLAVMYGMMPSANTDSWSSAPPENRFSSVKMPPVSVVWMIFTHSCTLPYDTPGLGSVAPSRYTAIIASVNSSFLRSSAALNALRKADGNFILLPGQATYATEVTIAEGLDELTVADRAGLHQFGRADVAAVREQFGQPVQVDHLERDLEVVAEALHLRQAHVDGHLPTLERRRDVLAGLRALRPAAGGLALGTLTATHPGLLGLGSGRRAQMVHLDRHLLDLLDPDEVDD